MLCHKTYITNDNIQSNDIKDTAVNKMLINTVDSLLTTIKNDIRYAFIHFGNQNALQRYKVDNANNATDKILIFHRATRYINASHIVKAFRLSGSSKKAADYFRLKEAREMLEFIEVKLNDKSTNEAYNELKGSICYNASTGTIKASFIERNKCCTPDISGTYVHPDCLIYILIWCNKYIANDLNKFVYSMFMYQGINKHASISQVTSDILEKCNKDTNAFNVFKGIANKYGSTALNNYITNILNDLMCERIDVELLKYIEDNGLYDKYNEHKTDDSLVNRNLMLTYIMPNIDIEATTDRMVQKYEHVMVPQGKRRIMVRQPEVRYKVLLLIRLYDPDCFPYSIATSTDDLVCCYITICEESKLSITYNLHNANCINNDGDIEPTSQVIMRSLHFKDRQCIDDNRIASDMVKYINDTTIEPYTDLYGRKGFVFDNLDKAKEVFNDMFTIYINDIDDDRA